LTSYATTPQVIFQVGQEWATGASTSSETATSHVFSCELAKPLQSWILASQKPQLLIADISEMSEAVVTDLVSEKLAARPNCTAAFCGWVCHDALHSFN